ncbi:MAG: RsmB/NOP family class I SAM-dependent RNA methyltransferase [Candidatus Hodarchaeota archaeon]
MSSFTPLSRLARDYGYSWDIVYRWVRYFGEKVTTEILVNNENQSTSVIRVNSLKWLKTPRKLIDILSKRGFDFTNAQDVSQYTYCLQKDAPFSLGATPEYLQGLYTPQGLRSQLPVIALAPSKKDLTLDLCAAPGSKTTQLAQWMHNEGQLIAIDRAKTRLLALYENLARMGVKNCLSLHLDARQIPKLNLKFDKILLDAPCTGSGIISRDSTRKTSRILQDILTLSKIQQQLLSAAIKVLKPGGALVYSTCSLEPEENELVIHSVLEKNPDIKIEELSLRHLGTPGLLKIDSTNLDPSLKNTKRFFPSSGHEGFFICKIKRVL